MAPAAAQTSSTLPADASLGIARSGTGWLAGSSDGADSYTVTRVNADGTSTWSYTTTTSNGGGWVLDTSGFISYVVIPDEPGTGTPATLTSLNLFGNERFTVQVSNDGAVLEMAASPLGVAYAETTGTIDQVLGFVTNTGDLSWTKPFTGFSSLRKIEADGSNVFSLGDDFVRSFDIDTGADGFVRPANGASQLQLTSSSVVTISDEGPGGDFEIRFLDKTSGNTTSQTTVAAPANTQFIADSFYEPTTGRIGILSESRVGITRTRHVTVLEEDGTFIDTAVVPAGGLRSFAATADTIAVAGDPIQTFAMSDFESPIVTDPCDGQSLIECYAPEFRFHPDEAFFPMDPDEFVDSSQLFFANSGLCDDDQLVDASPSSTGIANDIYLMSAQSAGFRYSLANGVCGNDGPEYSARTDYTRPYSPNSASNESERPTELSIDDGFYLRWQPNFDSRGNQPVNNQVTAPIFAQILQEEDDPTLRTITYQAFYAFDPKAAASLDVDEAEASALSAIDGVLAHEGDWERVDVVIDADDQPVEVRFFGHGCNTDDFKATNWLPWDDVEVTAGTHPVAYVAEGSHASYPIERNAGLGACPQKSSVIGKTDQTLFEAGSAVWQTWQTPELIINPRGECWHGYGGAWGETASVSALIDGILSSVLPDSALQEVGTHGTGPNGPFHNLVNGTDAERPAKCDAPRVLGWSGTAEKDWEDDQPFDLAGFEPGTEIQVSLASVEIPLGRTTASATGEVDFTVTIPAGTAPGVHRLIAREVATGEVVAVRQITVLAPLECISDTQPDIDGDYVIDSCDPNPTDGPLADADSDLVLNNSDNCPLVPNPGQETIADWMQGQACDEGNGFNAVDVVVAPADYPEAPEANPDAAVVDAGQSTEIDVLGNDVETDATIDPASLALIEGPSVGTASVTSAGVIAYNAPAGAGTTTITYAICDTTQRCGIGVVDVSILDGGETGPDICADLTPTIEGTDASETINGTSGDDIIFAYGGNDKINGKGGNDIVCAGEGNDTINLQNGNDIVDTGPGDDKVNAKNGDNTIYALEGNNTINGGNGVDTVTAGPGNDTINSKNGEDIIDAGDGDNTVNSSNGDDTVIAGSGDDVLNLGSGDDTGSAGDGDDRINAGGGTDTVDGGDGTDTCYGEENSTSCEL